MARKSGFVYVFTHNVKSPTSINMFCWLSGQKVTPQTMVGEL